ncbi:hypothetical protein J1605_017986 [Eschrichtius robustus]|uniref:Collagen alpha-1(I) chain-like n=1 Tax=Eschrichtius robustus TaxID=9764 RepID=A0AB34HVY6_ESCRO|nr:hypothetical protein J1605_017986 [Eschrichtius robustus]
MLRAVPDLPADLRPRKSAGVGEKKAEGKSLEKRPICGMGNPTGSPASSARGVPLSARLSRTCGTHLSAASPSHGPVPRAASVPAGGPEGSEPARASLPKNLYTARRSGGLIGPAAPRSGYRRADTGKQRPTRRSLPGAGGQLLITAARSARPGTTAPAGRDCGACAVRLHPVPGRRIRASSGLPAPWGSQGREGAETRSGWALSAEISRGLFPRGPLRLRLSEAGDSLAKAPTEPASSAAGSPAVRGSGTFLPPPRHTSPGSFWRVLSCSGRVFPPGTKAVLVPWAKTQETGAGRGNRALRTTGRGGGVGSPPSRPRPAPGRLGNAVRITPAGDAAAEQFRSEGGSACPAFGR